MRNLAKAGPLETAARDEKLPVVVRELDVTRPESIDRAVTETVAQQAPSTSSSTTPASAAPPRSS
jgi:hypothetical protein